MSFNKRITFHFQDPQHYLPEQPGVKLAIFQIFQGESFVYEYGFTEWDGEVFGLPESPAPGFLVVLTAWADTVDPMEVPKLIVTNT